MSEKVLIGNVRGPQGDIGPQGDPGPQGERGLDGANVLPTSEAVAQAVTEDGPAKDALSATYATVLNGIQDVVGLIRAQQQDINILIIGDSTTAMPNSWAYQLPGKLGELFPTHTIVERRWDTTGDLAWLSPTTVATGTGARTINVWNGAKPGMAWSYQLDEARRITMTSAADFDLLMFNHGHNMTNSAGEPNWATLAEVARLAVERFRSEAPNAAVVICAQNPRTDFPGRAERNADIYRRICAERGYAFVDVTQAFHDYVAANPGVTMPDLIESGGNLHPNALGFSVWINLVMTLFSSVSARSQSVPRQGPSIGDAARNYLPNGEGSINGVTAWTQSNVTITQESTPKRSKAYSLKLAKTANGAASLIYATLPVEMLRGKTITFVAEMYLPNGVNANTGQLQLRTNAGILKSGMTDAAYNRDQWTARTVTAKIPDDATWLRAYLNVDPSAGTAFTELYLDRAAVIIGKYPSLGFTSPPSIDPTPTPGSAQIDVFTSSGTWTKPDGAKLVEIVCVGGGGAGGSGARRAAGALATGGGGGGGAAVASRVIPASALGATEAVSVGAGGAGGSGVVGDNTNGNSGANGTSSSFGAHVRATGGTAGAGGTTSGAASGGNAGSGLFAGSAGAASSATGGAGGNSSGASGGAGGGGAGGGITTGDVANAGGNGAPVASTNGLGQGTGGAIETVGGSGTNVATGSGLPGPGAGGGGASTTGAAGDGGNGGLYGAGGGGGGASRNGNVSGKGGDGASGLVLVVTSF